jgi:hypothetical protein
MKRLICAILLLLSGSVFAGDVYSPQTFYADVAVGSFTAASNLTVQSGLSGGGLYTNGWYTNYFRINGYDTNRGFRLPISSVTTSVWYGAETNNWLSFAWRRKTGVSHNVIERSENGVDFTN